MALPHCDPLFVYPLYLLLHAMAMAVRTLIAVCCVICLFCAISSIISKHEFAEMLCALASAKMNKMLFR